MLRGMARRWFGALAAGAIVLFAGSSANATLVGDSVTFEFGLGGSDGNGPVSGVVGAGVEFDFVVFTVDFDATSILIEMGINVNGAAAIDWLFTDLDLIGGGIENAILTVLDGPAGAFSISHTADSITVSNLAFNETFGPGPFFRIDIVQAVPEPATLAILGSGLAGLALLRRRRPA